MAKQTSTQILSAILETLDLIYLNQQKELNPEEKKGKGKKKESSNATDNKDIDLNSSFDVLENVKLDKQKALDLTLFVSAIKALSTIDNKKLEKNINSAVKLIDSLGKIKIDGPKLQQSVAALGPIIGGIAQLASVSIFKLWTAMRFLTKRNANRIGEFIKAILESLKGVRARKDLEPLADFTKSIVGILTIFTDKTKNFNPITGRLKGWQINLYFWFIQKPLKKAFEKLKDTFDMLGDLNKKSLPELLSFIDMLLALKWNQVRKLNRRLKQLKVESAENFVNFTKTLLQAVPKKDSKIDDLKKLLEALSSLKIMSVLTLWLAGKMLDEQIGDNIGKCLKSLVSKIPSEKLIDRFHKTLKSINRSMITMVALLVILTVLAHWDWKALLIGLGALAGVMLLLVGFLWVLSFDSIQEAMKNTGKSLLLITASILLMVVAIGLILFMSTFSEQVNWLAVLGIFVGMGLMLLLMWGLTSIVKDNGKDMLLGILAMILLLGGVAFITYELLIPIGEKAKEALWGALLVVGLIVAMGLILYAATWWVQKMNDEGNLKYIGEAILLLVVIAGLLWLMSKAMDPWADLMIKIKDLDATDVAIKSGIIVALIVAMGAMLGALAKLTKVIGMKEMALGTAFLGAIEGLIWLLGKAMDPYIDVMERMKDLSWEDLGVGSAKVAAVIAGFGVMITGLGALTLIPGFKTLFTMGSIILGAISGLIWGLSEAILDFIEMMHKTAELNPTTIELFINNLVGSDKKPGLVYAIKETITALADIGPWAAMKARFISKMINPIFSGIGQFVDVLVQMANGQYVKEYDKEGKPVYAPITDDMYLDAAVAIAVGFSVFIDQLSTSFDGLSKSALKAMDKMKDSIGPIMEAVGTFANAIILLAAGTYTDPEGKPQRLMKSDYIKAADVLTQSFLAFITKLGEMDKDEIKQAVKNIKKLLKGDLDELINAIKTITDTLVNMAKNVAESNLNLLSSSILISSAISSFFNGLVFRVDLDDLEDELDDGIDAIKNAQYIMKILNEAFNNEKNTQYIEAISNYHTSFSMLFETLETLFTKNRLNELENRIDDFEDFITSINKTAKSGNKAVKSLIDTIKRLNTAVGNINAIVKKGRASVVIITNDMARLTVLLNNIDNQLIKKSNERVEALRKTTEAVSKLSEALNEVNIGMQRNIDLENEQRRLEHFHLFEWIKSSRRSQEPIKTEEFTETVKEENKNIFQKTAEKLGNKNKDEKSGNTGSKQQIGNSANIDPNLLANAIGQAVAVLLDKWIKAKKNVFFEFKNTTINGETYGS